ncbi:hypothetical protein M885DRAFT_515045 [Pelagophyceae sp. CCMP2097]|nr:hypothetical protein M885DRAFT_515045 [Pelagophyceae sp. CCMP2097]
MGMNIMAPVEGINYNFVMGMYVASLALGALFCVLEFVLAIEAVQGFYLIFSPFVPASLWCFFVRRNWLAGRSDKAKAE